MTLLFAPIPGEALPGVIKTPRTAVLVMVSCSPTTRRSSLTPSSTNRRDRPRVQSLPLPPGPPRLPDARSPQVSAWITRDSRRAMAMIVTIGFTPMPVGKTDPSPTYRPATIA